MQPYQKQLQKALEAYGVAIMAVRSDSELEVIWAPNVYLLLRKIVFSWKPILPRRLALRNLLFGLLVDLGLIEPVPNSYAPAESNPDDLPF